MATTTEPTRADWVAGRRHYLGGSDAAAVAGLDRYRSPLAVYLEKTGDLPAPELESEAADWGTILEPIVADQFARRTGLEIRRPDGWHPVAPTPHRHPDLPWMRASLDFDVVEDGHVGVYEGKTTTLWLDRDWDDDRIPDRAAIQVHHALAVTGRQFAYVACLIGGQRLVWRRVERDDDLIATLVDGIEVPFWDRVERRDPPDATAIDSDLLARLYDVEPESVVDLDAADVDPLLAQYLAAQQAEKAAKAEKDEAANRIRQLLTTHEVGQVAGEVVLKNTQVDATWVDAYERAGYRRLTVTKGGRARVR